jgi:hypothetical protein
VILDSSIMIEAERQRLDVTRFLKLVAERIERKRRQARRTFLGDLKATVAIYPRIPSMICSSTLCALERGYAIEVY